MNNPYIWDAVDPKICYGRGRLLAALISGLASNSGRSFGLAGGRRMGKTTVLRRVELDLRDRVAQWRESGLLVVPVYIDGLALPRPLTEEDTWGLLLRRIQSMLPDVSITRTRRDFDGFKKETSKIVEGIEVQLRVVVMFDEIELILTCDWANAFLGHWRALLSNTPGLSECFSAVFAGARDLNVLRHDVGSPLKDILEWRSLRPLAYEDACLLMQEPIDRQWDSSFLSCVYRETGGHPMLLQYVMQQVCLHWSEGHYTQSPEKIVERATEKFASERRWQFSEWWERYCSPTAQRVYKRLYDTSGDVMLRQLVGEFGRAPAHDAVEILQHVGLVEEVEAHQQGLAYRCIGEMFRRWYARYGTLADAPRGDPHHDSELHDRLVAVRPELGDKYLSAWRIYQAEMPNYSGAVVELRDILTLLLNIVAPVDRVQSEPGFQHEPGRDGPTRRQRVRYAARMQYNREHAKEITGDFDLVEQLSEVVTSSYGRASGQVHTTATREDAYRALKQWESIFAQLVPAVTPDSL